MPFFLMDINSMATPEHLKTNYKIDTFRSTNIKCSWCVLVEFVVSTVNKRANLWWKFKMKWSNYLCFGFKNSWKCLWKKKQHKAFALHSHKLMLHPFRMGDAVKSVQFPCWLNIITRNKRIDRRLPIYGDGQKEKKKKNVKI